MTSSDFWKCLHLLVHATNSDKHYCTVQHSRKHIVGQAVAKRTLYANNVCCTAKWFLLWPYQQCPLKRHGASLGGRAAFDQDDVVERLEPDCDGVEAALEALGLGGAAAALVHAADVEHEHLLDGAAQLGRRRVELGPPLLHNRVERVNRWLGELDASVGLEHVVNPRRALVVGDVVGEHIRLDVQHGCACTRSSPLISIHRLPTTMSHNANS
jgi:hypothetical protein